MFDYKENDLVKIKNDKYDNIPTYLTGNVMRIEPRWKDAVAVKVTGIRNPRSVNGWYYFDADCISLLNGQLDTCSEYPKTINQCSPHDVREEMWKRYINAIYGKNKIIMEDKNMNNKQLINGYRVAKVEFRDITTNVVNYAMYEDAWANEGEYVLCATASHGHVIGKVVSIEPVDTDAVVSKGREIICKIDYSMYDARQERLKRLAKLKDKMEQKRKELNDLAVYQALAANCPEMAAMVEEFKELL